MSFLSNNVSLILNLDYRLYDPNLFISLSYIKKFLSKYIPLFSVGQIYFLMSYVPKNYKLIIKGVNQFV